MTVPVLDNLASASNNADVYEALIDAFEFISEENENERSLVTVAQWEQWERARDRFSQQLYRIGASLTDEGVWLTQEMDTLRSTFLRASRQTRQELEALQVNVEKEQKAQEVGRVRRLMQRLQGK